MEHPKKVKIFAIITLTWFIFSSLATWVIVLLDGFWNNENQDSTEISTQTLTWSTSSWNIADFSVEEISTWTTNK